MKISVTPQNLWEIASDWGHTVSALHSANRQSPSRCLFIFVMHVGTGIAHGADHPVQRDKVLTVTAQCHLRRVDRFHRGNRVALDARHLHQPAHRVAGQAEVVFQTDFRRVAQLRRGGTQDVRQTGRRLYCRQFNPASDLEFDNGEVKILWRVLTLRDLLG